ncbi:fasciclin domain-containing protein [Candidatus Gracilibacteria bacterium]|nr:fasciclin domain-containing protein [Candidatus Gracilibacteria bacterium]
MKKQQIIVPIILLATVTLLASCGSNVSEKVETKTNMPVTTNTPGSMMPKDDSMMKDEGVMVGGAMMVKSRDIVDNAVLASNVTTLVAAVKAAGLVETLKSPGPFTVFAPTNAAFAKLPAGTVDTLVKPENKGALTDILTYHVVAGRYTAADLKDGLTLTTVEGKKLLFKIMNGKLMINGSAMVETADVISSNGITHVIDTVLIPAK